MVKCKYFAQFPVNNLPHSVMSTFVFHTDISSNLHKSFIISGLSSFLLCKDVNIDNKSDKIMNIWFFDF